MSTTATGRMTLGAVFGTISTTASAVSGIVETAAKSVHLLDNYVEVSLQEQRKRQAVEAVVFEQRLKHEVAAEILSLSLAADKLCENSRSAEIYNGAIKDISEALASLKS